MNLLQVSKMTEKEARQYLEGLRWPNGPICPHCGLGKAYRIIGKSARPGLCECHGCKSQFTVTVGTVMHRSKISLQKWVLAFYLICSRRKPTSALQLQSDLGLGSYRTAWHLAHRIRKAMSQEPLASLLKGVIEADETWVGGKPRVHQKGGQKTKKTPVLALVERGGSVRAKSVDSVSAQNLKSFIIQNVDRDSRIMTDERSTYRGIGNFFEGGHRVIKHYLARFARGDVHVNNAESFFSGIKRGVYGTFHHVSKKHLGRYIDEAVFRWDMRQRSEGDRLAAAIVSSQYRRLELKELFA